MLRWRNWLKRLSFRNLDPSGKRCEFESHSEHHRKTKKIIKNESFLQLGKKYGVSDNAVRKWAEQYGIDMSIAKFKHKAV